MLFSNNFLRVSDAKFDFFFLIELNTGICEGYSGIETHLRACKTSMMKLFFGNVNGCFAGVSVGFWQTSGFNSNKDKAEKISVFEPYVRTDFNPADISYRVTRLIALLTCLIKKMSQKDIETHLQSIKDQW